MSELPSDVILEEVNKSFLQDSDQFRLLLALYDQETDRNNGKPNYPRLKTAVKLHLGKIIRTRNIRVRSDVVERRSVTKSSEGKKTYVKMKVEECFQWKAHGQCSKGVSCSFSHDTKASGNSGGGQRETKGTVFFSRIFSKSKTDGEGQQHLEESGKQEESFSNQRGEIPCRFRICQNPSCNFWHNSECQNYKSQKDYLVRQMPFLALEKRESPAESQRKVVQRISFDIEGVCTVRLCISRFFAEKMFPT